MTLRFGSLTAWFGAAALLCALASVGQAQEPAARAANSGEGAPSDSTPASAEGMPSEGAALFSSKARPPASSISPLQRKTSPAEMAARRASGVGASTSEGSVLRMVAGVGGIVPEPDTALPEPIPSPPPSLTPGNSLSPGESLAPSPTNEDPSALVDPYPPDGYGGAEAGGPPRFVSPYQATPRDEYTGPPPRRPLLHLPPPGILPWVGPRTSEQDRFIGWGQPLYGASWLNRPLGAGWFAGFMQGSHPIQGLVGQHGGFFGGYRFTWDYDYYYGLEARLGGGAIGLKYPGYDYPTATSDLYVADINVLYYPLGDARWRPYVSLGLGTTKISFYDREDEYFSGVLVSLPFGVGLKYRWREWLAARADITDNLAFGRGPFSTMNNVSYTAGIEIRFGGLRKSYFPWHPSRQLW